MLKLILSGILGNDAEVREVNDGKLIKFSVAINKDYKNAEGVKVEKTDWIQALLWRNGKQSSKVSEFLKKGKRVILEGDPGVDSYITKEGKAKGQLTITIKNLELVN